MGEAGRLDHDQRPDQKTKIFDWKTKKMKLQVLMNLIFTISFQIHATPLPQDTGSSLGGLFGSLLVGLGERAVQEGLADRVQELGLAGGQAVVESSIISQLQDQAVDSAISGGSRVAGTVGNQVVSNLPSREQVMDQVVSNLPSTDAVAEQVVANLPTTDDVASELPPAEQVIETLPRGQIIDQVRGSLPSAEQVVEQVGPNLPTAQQIGGQLLNLFG